MLEANADVAIIGRSERVFSTARELSHAAQREVVPIQADLSDRQRLQRAFDACLDQLGTLDILIVSHGIQRRVPAAEFPLADWDAVLETNLTSMFVLNQQAGRVMLAKGKGKIINIASLTTYIGSIEIPAYAASKGGVGQLTKALANEWTARGVNVNAIAPGYMETDLTRDLSDDPQRNRMILSRIPAGRWGRPSDLKGAAIFLASDASDYVSGAIIPVDGGWLGW
jgi:2-deoxy-D-gluconate 3-dehydrogenase